MRIASVAKAFSGAVVLHLVQQGLVGLNDTIGQRLPSLPAAWGAVTVRQMLNHTSGLPDYTKSKGFKKQLDDDPNGFVSAAHVISWVQSDALKFTPGSSYEYSNTDNIVLGLIAEAVTGEPYGDAAAEDRLRPRKLRQTTLPTTVALPTPFIHGYAVAPGAKPDRREHVPQPERRVGVGRDRLNARRPQQVHAQLPRADVLRQRAAARPDAVRRGVLESARTRVNSAGLAIFRYRTRCGTVYGHTGNFPGYTQFAAATRNGERAVTTSLNIPAPTGGLLERLRAVQTTAVCALLGKKPSFLPAQHLRGLLLADMLGPPRGVLSRSRRGRAGRRRRRAASARLRACRPARRGAAASAPSPWSSPPNVERRSGSAPSSTQPPIAADAPARRGPHQRGAAIDVGLEPRAARDEQLERLRRDRCAPPTPAPRRVPPAGRRDGVQSGKPLCGR